MLDAHGADCHAKGCGERRGEGRPVMWRPDKAAAGATRPRPVPITKARLLPKGWPVIFERADVGCRGGRWPCEAGIHGDAERADGLAESRLADGRGRGR